MAKRAEGCKSLYIAKIKENGDYDTLKAIPGLEEITFTNNYAEGSAYSDNAADTTVKKLAYVDVSITVRELSAEIEALLMGKTHDSAKGIISSTANDTLANVAVLYEQTNSDGTTTRRVFYECSLSRDEISNTTVTDSISYDSVTLTGRAIPKTKATTGSKGLGLIDMTIESDKSSTAGTTWSNFFTTVQFPA